MIKLDWLTPEEDMKMNEIIARRQEYNYKILNMLKFNFELNRILIEQDKVNWFFEALHSKICKCPQMRFGQIYYNYLFDEIEAPEEIYEPWVYELTNIIFKDRFNIFNEESYITLKNLNKK
ncbi:MAG: hypothetical protein J1F35_08295 [Erysipelotrichales bacterium]|nr:hypothetical protein [Erysipelotrichales bacterium]